MTVEPDTPATGPQKSLQKLHWLPAGSISVTESARFAYDFLFTRFWSVARLLWIPLFISTLSLYFGASGYLENLLAFIATPNAQVASLALGTLAAGVLLAVFFYSIGIAAIANLANGETPSSAWLYLRMGRQEWRLYAGYLRFLLLLSLLAGGLAFVLASLEPLLPLSANSSLLIYAVAIVAAMGWFIIRAAFLIPPIVAQTQGAIIRAAWSKSQGNSLRIGTLILVLLVPFVLVHAIGQFTLSIQVPGLGPLSDQPLADYVRSTQAGLATFMVFWGIASFFAITLLTAGAVSAYRRLTLQEP